MAFSRPTMKCSSDRCSFYQTRLWIFNNTWDSTIFYLSCIGIKLGPILASRRNVLSRVLLLLNIEKRRSCRELFSLFRFVGWNVEGS